MFAQNPKIIIETTIYRFFLAQPMSLFNIVPIRLHAVVQMVLSPDTVAHAHLLPPPIPMHSPCPTL